MNQSNNINNFKSKNQIDKTEKSQIENIKVDSKSDSSIFSFNFESVKIYLFLIISVILVIVALFFLIIPQYSNFSENRDNIDILSQDLDSVKNLREYLESLAGLEDELDNNIEIALHALSKEEDELPYILDQLIQITELSLVNVESLSLSGSIDSSNIKEGEPIPVRIQMGISGSFDKINLFLSNLEFARRIITLNSFQFSRKSESRISETLSSESLENNSGQQFTLNMSLMAYFMKDVNADSIKISSVTSVPKYENVVNFLKLKKFYDPQTLPIFIESENPFEQFVDLNGQSEIEEESFVSEDEISQESNAQESSGIITD